MHSLVLQEQVDEYKFVHTEINSIAPKTQSKESCHRSDITK